MCNYKMLARILDNKSCNQYTPYSVFQEKNLSLQSIYDLTWELLNLKTFLTSSIVRKYNFEANILTTRMKKPVNYDTITTIQ